MKTIFDASELNELYEGGTARVRAICTLTTELVGGQPANDKELRAFIEHHLGLTGSELNDAFARIKRQEIGEREATPKNGEVREVEVYGLNVLRADDDGGRWIGNWQIKACLKCAASRLGLFVKRQGAKGDMSEMGRLGATGMSLGTYAERIRLMHAGGTPYTGGQFRKFMGRVNTPQGAKSIVHDSEVAPAGTRFEFELRMPFVKITTEDIARVFAAAQVVGLGSARSMECGHFKIDQLEVIDDKKK